MERASCDPNLLAAYLEDRVDEVEKRRLLEHVATCADCRGSLAMLGRAAAAGELSLPPASDGVARERSRRVSVRTWLPLAASVAIATAVAIRLVPFSPAPPGGSRSTAPTPPVRDVPSKPAVPATAPSVMSGSASAPELGPPPAGMIDERLLIKRGATRRVGGKTFRSVAGEWVDTSFDPDAALPIVAVKGAQERAALLARIPDLSPYPQLGDRVVVVFEGTVYRFSP
jgi:hypothetical protein